MTDELCELARERAEKRAQIVALCGEVAQIERRMMALLRQSQIPGLTVRETEVLALLFEGAANKDIAAKLGIAERTAKYHVSNVLARCGAHSRGELVSFTKGRLDAELKIAV